MPENWWVSQQIGHIYVCWSDTRISVTSYRFKQKMLHLYGETGTEFRLEEHRFNEQLFKRSFGFVVGFLVRALPCKGDAIL